jgi:hypothetical protein
MEIVTKKIISFGTRLGKNGSNCTFRQLLLLSPKTILDSMESDNRFVLDNDVKEYLIERNKTCICKSKLDKINKEIFEKVLELSELREKRNILLSENKIISNSDELSMGSESMYYMYRFSGVRTGM